MKQAFVGIVVGWTLVACAHTQTVETSSSQRSTSIATAEPAVSSAPPAPPPDVPLARPRLSQTLTLGQGTEAAYVPSGPPRTATEGNQQGVVVNNTVIVQNGGGYGYPIYRGGYGGYGNAQGRVTDGRGSSASHAPSMWSTTGWEGARRTAAPGQTPGVGGNWSPPPSYGPAQMK